MYYTLDVNLYGLPLPVNRKISCSNTLSVFDFKKLAAILFQFDFHQQIEIEVGDKQVEFPTNEVAIETKLVSFFTDEETILYRYHGKETWELSVTLVQKKQDGTGFATCLEGTGQAILHPQMTREIFDEINEHVLSGQNLETFTVDGGELQLLAPTLQDFDVAVANDILSAIFAAEIADSVTSDESEEEIDFSVDPQLRNAELVEFYTEIIGMNDEQAAYHVLYEMSVNNIVDILKVSGLSSNEIEAALRGALVLEDDVYQLVQNDFDNLNALPPRKEIFSEKDEERLVKVEELFFGTIEEFDLSVEEFLEMDPEKMTDIEQRFFEQLQQLDNQLLS